MSTTQLSCLSLLPRAQLPVRQTRGSAQKPHLQTSKQCAYFQKDSKFNFVSVSDFSTPPKLSLNYMSIVPISRITLSLCDGSKRSQKFEFTYKKDVHLKSVPNTCWDFQGGDRQEIQQYPCHGQKGNQLFKLTVTRCCFIRLIERQFILCNFQFRITFPCTLILHTLNKQDLYNVLEYHLRKLAS